MLEALRVLGLAIALILFIIKIRLLMELANIIGDKLRKPIICLVNYLRKVFSFLVCFQKN